MRRSNKIKLIINAQQATDHIHPTENPPLQTTTPLLQNQKP